MSAPEDLPLSDLPSELSKKTVENFPLAMVICDPTLEDCPIVYVNTAFTRVTGYAPDMAIGQNCRFLQGERTHETDRRIIREAIEAGEECTVDILNYKADGTPFMNRLLITPLHDDDTGEVIYFLGVQTERSRYTSYAERAHDLDERLTELQHRVKNHLSMILAMIRLEADGAESAEAFADVLTQRVQAISLLYDEFATNKPHPERSTDTVALGAYLSRVAGCVHGLDGRTAVRTNIETERLEAGLDAAGRLGMFLSEVLTNSLQHAFRPGEPGEIRVGLEATDEGGVLCISDDGHGTEKNVWPSEASLGGRIVLKLIERLNGELSVEAGHGQEPGRPGTCVTLRFRL
ncbi:PAS domain-containing protein [Parvularcula oceani]|uniref:PAS domain-containing protein n=1 Tax=Parvularcula oceani TaxID=1247963 RepID=UPI00068A4FDC|nr:PAS domain-containing protein [Parvularcula oceani]